jgi:ABC-type multidrug transport system fused ATPase/permease subunit
LAKGIINSNEKNINNNALEEVSFSIKKWEKVAFCGRTGSGKSSIFNLLVRLYDF